MQWSVLFIACFCSWGYSQELLCIISELWSSWAAHLSYLQLLSFSQKKGKTLHDDPVWISNVTSCCLWWTRLLVLVTACALLHWRCNSLHWRSLHLPGYGEVSLPDWQTVAKCPCLSTSIEFFLQNLQVEPEVWLICAWLTFSGFPMAFCPLHWNAYSYLYCGGDPCFFCVSLCS